LREIELQFNSGFSYISLTETPGKPSRDVTELLGANLLKKQNLLLLLSSGEKMEANMTLSKSRRRKLAW
jgi:hypothetical protein